MPAWAILGDGVPISRSELLTYDLSDEKFEILHEISGKRTSRFANAIEVSALVITARRHPNITKISILMRLNVMLYDKANSISVTFIYF